jgi:hypothetical protein
MKSLLGAAVLGLKRYSEAEPLIVEGYDGLKDDPAVSPDRKRRALDRVVELYRTWNAAQPDPARSAKLSSWRAAAASASQPKAAP